MPTRNQKVVLSCIACIGVISITGILTWRFGPWDDTSSKTVSFSSANSYYAVGDLSSASSSICPDPWIPGDSNQRGNIVLYEDYIYECRRDECQTKGWAPIAACDPTARTALGECPAAWSSTLAFLYDKGDEVTFSDVLYYCRDKAKCRDASNEPGDASNPDAVEAWLALGPCPHVVVPCPDIWMSGEAYDEEVTVEWEGQIYVCLNDRHCGDFEPGSDGGGGGSKSGKTSRDSKSYKQSKSGKSGKIVVWRLLGPCFTRAPTNFPSLLPSSEPSISPSGTPSVSLNPSASPSYMPSSSPSRLPSMPPSDLPSLAPSQSPSISTEPSSSPTTSFPTFSPTEPPTDNPTANPTASPTRNPTTSPFAAPSDFPSKSPSATPSENPTFPFPTFSPTVPPTESPTKSASPSSIPTP
mmetsp:Transcript_18309/g.38412  ORF Transcript_18309/g.38412 Transcript_18309/m.38412 type:complete len:412 (+) Transcript_18309:109-1344(+)|eukprot:CAMPEP_0171335930 /NCGR_PEP_ID=MMETSP0878-20121228/5657_1 /TAXON_ID=67004 /ORGANISM="Thalassiosira weissflogii, Strain CCMP1336" /LENGTH=411 /DNA_ID=CAMNT_0011837277 /DNA_START=34 /DNA_END=1269 /DNA_ORIENTATION=-